MGEEIKKKKIEHMKPIILSEDGLENFKKTNKIKFGLLKGKGKITLTKTFKITENEFLSLS